MCVYTEATHSFMKKGFSEHALINKLYGFPPRDLVHMAINALSLVDLSKAMKQFFHFIGMMGI